LKAEIKDGAVLLTADLSAAKDASAIWGMTARGSTISSAAWRPLTEKLEIHGLGFRAELAGQKLKPWPWEVPPGDLRRAQGNHLVIDRRRRASRSSE